jgi:hypothetical protein
MAKVISATTKTSQRIHTFDILRGFFLAVILVNHIELYPSFYDLFTGRGRLLVSAAEGFFFMSGLLVGMVYRRRIMFGFKFILLKMWKRALELYVASIVFTLFFTWVALITNHPSIKDGLYDVINWPHIITETLLMRYGFGWADFLSRFAILMFLAPLGFYLLMKNKWWLLLIASLTAWVFRGQNFTLSWQLIFAFGMMIGYYWNELAERWNEIKIVPRKRIVRSVLIVSAITFALSYASVYVLSLLNQRWLELPIWFQSFTFHWNSVNAWVWLYAQKWTMGPVRVIVFLLWFTSLFILVLPTGTTLWQNFLITTLALIALVAATMVYSRYQGSKIASKKSSNLEESRAGKLKTETY